MGEGATAVVGATALSLMRPAQRGPRRGTPWMMSGRRALAGVPAAPRALAEGVTGATLRAKGTEIALPPARPRSVRSRQDDGGELRHRPRLVRTGLRGDLGATVRRQAEPR